MKTVSIRPYQESDRIQVIQVWGESGLLHSDNDPDKDIDRKIQHSPEGLLVAEEDNRVVGTVMVGYEGHRGWINYLGVLPEKQKQGIGTLLMSHAERLLKEAKCAKINLQVRTTNATVIAFYNSHGYAIEDCLSLDKRLEFD